MTESLSNGFVQGENKASIFLRKNKLVKPTDPAVLACLEELYLISLADLKNTSRFVIARNTWSLKCGGVTLRFWDRWGEEILGLGIPKGASASKSRTADEKERRVTVDTNGISPAIIRFGETALDASLMSRHSNLDLHGRAN